MKKTISKQIVVASFVYILLAISFIWVSKIALHNQNILCAWILVFTSNIITLIYLFGIRKYIKQMTT